jgi:hypothetical protein
MTLLTDFEARLPDALRAIFRQLDTPFAIQTYLDAMPYVAEERDRSPLNVLLDQQCHCLDGGLLAALALWRLGFKPLILDLVPEPGADDDHVLALYQVEGRWGAVAKSNFVGLGFREAIHKNLRELALTYFEHYCNLRQEKTLRGYTRPLDLSRYTRLDWALDETGANRLYRLFYRRQPVPLLTPEQAARLARISDRVYKAETLYTDLDWAFGNRE